MMHETQHCITEASNFIKKTNRHDKESKDRKIMFIHRNCEEVT